MNITDYIVQDGEDEDKVLHVPTFDVNTRLYRSSPGYRLLIQTLITYMLELLGTTFKNYREIVGISGANVGVPFNIVIVEMNDGEPMLFVNPVITAASKEKVKRRSNCGSIGLPVPIWVLRPEWVVCNYYDLELDEHAACELSGREAATLEHEIDHNQGILITDKE